MHHVTFENVLSSVEDTTPEERAYIREQAIRSDPLIAGGRAKYRARVVAKIA